jgi:microcystin degradation protein MlrC
VATLDLHANVTARMARHADALVLYHTAPHVDVFETGQRGAGPGFKAFRPLFHDATGRLHVPGNQELKVRVPGAAFSDQQTALSAEDFYAQIGRLTNPRGLPRAGLR